jgi:two-component system chemotaxis response regulator CheY
MKVVRNPPFRILVVDDDRATRVLVHACLQYFGYSDVVDCANGEEALKSFTERPAQLVISDLKMPKLDGLGLLRAIRLIPGCSHTPVILLTSRGEESTVKRALESKVDCYMVKPFTIAGLREKIEALAEPLRRRTEGPQDDVNVWYVGE